MDKPKKDKVKWIQLGLLSSLVATVVILAVMIFQMQARLDSLGQPAKRDTATPQSPSKEATTPPDQTDTPNADSDDNWLWSPFDSKTWDPFAEMQRMQTHIDRMFSDSFSRFGKSPRFSDLVRDPGFSPQIDVREEEDQFVIRVDLPGVEDGSVDVHVDGREVQITGKRSDVVTNKDKNGHIIRQERRAGRFSRTIELPEKVNPDKMTAKKENGVFTISLPKA